MKKCSTCKQIKPLECFGKDRRAKNGLRSQCKECERKYRAKAEQNRDPEKKRAYAKRYRDNHKATEKSRFQNWKTNNPSKYKAYHSRNKIKKRCAAIEYDRDITLEALYNRDGGVCALCGKPCDYENYIFDGNIFIAGNAYPSIDHIKPLSKGGSHTWNNVQLAHKQCNSIKSNKEAQEWAS